MMLNKAALPLFVDTTAVKETACYSARCVPMDTASGQLLAHVDRCAASQLPLRAACVETCDVAKSLLKAPPEQP